MHFKLLSWWERESKLGGFYETGSYGKGKFVPLSEWYLNKSINVIMIWKGWGGWVWNLDEDWKTKLIKELASVWTRQGLSICLVLKPMLYPPESLRGRRVIVVDPIQSGE